MTDAYQFWRKALVKQQANEDCLPTIYPGVSYDNPQPGLYKMRPAKGAAHVPVQIMVTDAEGKVQHKWVEGLSLTGQIDGKPADADTIAKRWHYMEAVSKEDMAHYKANGVWPGEVAIGHNSGDLSLIDQLRDYLATASAWLKGREIKSKVEADQCQNYRAEVLRLKGLVDKEREAKVRPHLDAQQAINGEYNPLIKEAESLNVMLRTAPEAYAKAEDARLKAEQQAKWQAEQERVRKEREAIEAERAKKLEQDPIAALTEPEPELPMAPPPPEPVKFNIGGQRGKVGGLKVYWEAEITDYPKALQHYANHPDVQALVLKLAKAEVKLNKGAVTIPGVRPYEDRRIA